MFSIMLAALNVEDQDFVQQLYEKYSRKMYAYAFKILHTQHDAENAVSDAMVNIIKHIDKFQGETDENIRNRIMISIKSIVENAAKDVYNDNKKRYNNETDFYFKNYDDDDEKFIDVEDEDYDLEDIVITNDEYRAVQDAISKLPQNMKDAIALVYGQGFSCREAADFLCIGESAVKARLFKARIKIKEILGDKFNGRN